MAANLLQMINKKIDDRLVGQIGAVLNENEQRTRNGIAAATPTLLRGVMGVAMTDQGTQMVERELDPFDDGIIHEYSKQLEFDKSRAIIDDGSDLVQAFFGNGTVRTMSVISRESGLGASKCRSLTGLLMPLVLGVIGEHRKEKNLDTAGFRRLLESQNDYVARKIPEGVCAALNLPKLEKKPFYPPQSSRPTLSPYRPATVSASVASAQNSSALNASANVSPAVAAASSLTTPAHNSGSDSRVPSAAGVSSTKGSTSGTQDDGGLGWLWGVILPLILMLGMLWWLYDRSTRTPVGTDGSQIESQEDVAVGAGWDDPSPPMQFDKNQLMNDDVPSIAPSFDFDEPESDEPESDETENNETENDEGGKARDDQSTAAATDADAATSNGPTLETPTIDATSATTPPSPVESESSEVASAPATKNKPATSSTVAGESLTADDSIEGPSSEPSNVEPEQHVDMSLKNKNRQPTIRLATATNGEDETTDPGKESAKLVSSPRSVSSLAPTVSIPPITSSAATSETPTFAASHSPNSLPQTSLASNSLPSGTASPIPSSPVPSRSSENDVAKSVSKQAEQDAQLGQQFTAIADGVTNALGQVTNEQSAIAAAKTINSLSDDLYDLGPQLQSGNGAMRLELDGITHAFAADIEKLYDERIDELANRLRFCRAS